MRIRLSPAETFVVRENPNRLYLLIQCNGNFEVDNIRLTPYSIFERLAVFNENPQRAYYLKNIDVDVIECVILEELG
jgi:hypothetical protein